MDDGKDEQDRPRGYEGEGTKAELGTDLGIAPEQTTKKDI
jgi:hypothetical protein